jgi:hypothetical protein
MLGIGTVMAAPSQAATTVYGSAQLKYTINATASISIATNYSTTAPIGAQGTGAPTILSSTAGACTAPAAETAGTLTFTGITPGSSATSYNGCYYKNALSIGLLSNDALGVKMYEYADTQVTGTQICVFNLNGTPGTAVPTANPAISTATGTPAAYAAGCQGTNVFPLVYNGATTAGTGFGGAGVPPGVTTAVTSTPTATTTFTGGTSLYSTSTAPPAGWNFFGQDVQLNVSASAPSGAQTNVITVALIPN